MTNKVSVHFKFDTNQSLKLAKTKTLVEPSYKTSKQYHSQLNKNKALLEEYQTRLYAEHKRSLLLVFQGMDTSGKDGAIKHVMSGVNPQGCSVVSFKIPTTTELNHDFFWRVNQALPIRGHIGIFNRSYYEEVLITRVHPELLLKENLLSTKKIKDKFWINRYQDIINYELYLKRQGYEVIKIFIHISKDMQKKRILDRFKNPQKNWKISEADFRERKCWKEYQIAHEDCINNTSSKNCPWYIVPGDDKQNARLIISNIIVSRLKKMQLQYPQLDKGDKVKLHKLRKKLLQEK